MDRSPLGTASSKQEDRQQRGMDNVEQKETRTWYGTPHHAVLNGLAQKVDTLHLNVQHRLYIQNNAGMRGQYNNTPTICAAGSVVFTSVPANEHVSLSHCAVPLCCCLTLPTLIGSRENTPLCTEERVHF